MCVKECSANLVQTNVEQLTYMIFLLDKASGGARNRVMNY